MISTPRAAEEVLPRSSLSDGSILAIRRSAEIPKSSPSGRGAQSGKKPVNNTRRCWSELHDHLG